MIFLTCVCFILITIYKFLDFGVDELIEFKNATKFPWLLSNVFDLTTKEQLAEGEIKRIIEWQGMKVGVFSWYLSYIYIYKLFSVKHHSFTNAIISIASFQKSPK